MSKSLKHGAHLGLRWRERDNKQVWQVLCPTCETWGDIDEDQLHGRVSTQHAVEDGGCSWHVTVDWAAVFSEAALFVLPDLVRHRPETTRHTINLTPDEAADAILGFINEEAERRAQRYHESACLYKLQLHDAENDVSRLLAELGERE